MKRHSLALGIFLMAGATGIFSACNEKKREPEKPTTTAKTETATNQEETPVVDTAQASTEITTDTATTTNAAVNASAQKFGHINSADLIQLMPETKKADASLQAYVNTLEKNLGGLQNDYRKKITEFQAQEKTMIDAVKETRIKAIQDLEMQMQQSQEEGQQQIAAKREALYKPILDRAEKAIKAVGKENGYDYVFDTNAGSFVYAKDSHDIMPLVKKKLGLR